MLPRDGCLPAGAGRLAFDSLLPDRPFRDLSRYDLVRIYQRRSALATGPSWLAATASAASRSPALRDR